MIKISERYVACDECPMIWGLERQLKLAEKYGTEPQLEYCGCDKTGDGKFYCYGFCEDAFVDVPTDRTHGKRKTGRAYRRNRTRHKDKRKRKIIATCGYKPTIGYVDYDLVDGKWIEVGNHIKYPKNSNAQKYLKRISNKKVRKFRGDISSGNAYRRIFDYRWELY